MKPLHTKTSLECKACILVLQKLGRKFREIYNMNVVEIPTSSCCQDAVDMLFATADAKYRKLIKELGVMKSQQSLVRLPLKLQLLSRMLRRKN